MPHINQKRAQTGIQRFPGAAEMAQMLLRVPELQHFGRLCFLNRGQEIADCCMQQEARTRGSTVSNDGACAICCSGQRRSPFTIRMAWGPEAVVCLPLC